MIGPDYFGFYTHEISNLLSQDEDYLPFLPSHIEGKGSLIENHCSTKENCNVSSASLFNDAIGDQLSDFKKERLTSLVRQSLTAFAQEVDEILNPIYQICRVQTLLSYKMNMLRLPGGTSESDHGSPPKKKPKTVSGACDMEFIQEKVSLPVTESNGQHYLDVNVGTFSESDIDPDLLVLLDSDWTKVEEMTKKHSDKLFTTIAHMEQKLEEFLDILVSKCRSMTLVEKQQLRKMIQELPPRNLDRVVEIIQRNKPTDRYSRDEILVDLEKENKVTLWRLYFYVRLLKMLGTSERHDNNGV